MVESRDKLEGAYELVQRENVVLTAHLRETNAELVEAIDRACAAERRAAELDGRLARAQKVSATLFASQAEWIRIAGEYAGEVDELRVRRAEGIAIFRDLATDGTALVPVDALGSVTRLGPCSLLAYHRARGAV